MSWGYRYLWAQPSRRRKTLSIPYSSWDCGCFDVSRRAHINFHFWSRKKALRATPLPFSFVKNIEKLYPDLRYLSNERDNFTDKDSLERKLYSLICRHPFWHDLHFLLKKKVYHYHSIFSFRKPYPGSDIRHLSNEGYNFKRFHFRISGKIYNSEINVIPDL